MIRASFLKRLTLRGIAAALGLSLGMANTASAQNTLPPMAPRSYDVPYAVTQMAQAVPAGERPQELPAPQAAPAPAPVQVAPAASCSTCGGGGGGARMGCSSCGGGGGGGGPGCGCVSYPCGYNGCFPGHQNCCGSCGGCGSCNADGPFGKFFCCFYSCLCCPDPCYEPCYRPEANSAFWVDGARPVTMTRFRYDSGHNFEQPDRSEFFWARTGGGGKGPGKIETSMKYDSIRLYQEAATGKASFFIEQDYRAVDPDTNNHASGFGDMNIGTKALLFDCELMQLTFQFKTYLPVGSAGKGLGTGHVSLEPSLLLTVKLLPETYFQAQGAEWIPIGGDPAYQGSVLHHHYAINHVLWRPLADVPFIGSLEFNAYSFQDGQYSDPALGQFQKSSGYTWMTAGPSLRVAICTRLDLGFSAQFGLNEGPPQQIYRTDFRIRF